MRVGELGVWGWVCFLVALPFLQPCKCTQSFSPHITKTPKHKAHRKAPAVK